MNTLVPGVGLAKYVFSACKVEAAGHVLGRRDLDRADFSVRLARVPAAR